MATAADFERIGNYAVMYNKNLHIDRHNSTRTVPMEVLCLGYPRTGTLTMHKALSILGYPSNHFSSIYENPLDSDMWMEAINAKYHGIGPAPDKAFFDGILGHCGATTDIPSVLFGRELVSFYPGAKVVLVQRNEDSWFKSFNNFCEAAYAPPLYILGRLDPSWLGRFTRVGYGGVHVAAGYSATVDQVRVRCRDAYRRHYAEIREYTPSDRLLEFDLKDGWEPLCKFLGKDVPDVPFPHENYAERNHKSFEELGAKALKRIGTNLAILVGAVGVAIGLYYRLN